MNCPSLTLGLRQNVPPDRRNGPQPCSNSLGLSIAVQQDCLQSVHSLDNVTPVLQPPEAGESGALTTLGEDHRLGERQ
jgi:hypothetical protein